MLPSFGHSTKGLTNSQNEKMKNEDMGELFKKRPSGVKAANAAPAAAAAAATKPDAKSAAKTKAAAATKPASKTVVKSGILPASSDAKYYFQYHILMK